MIEDREGRLVRRRPGPLSRNQQTGQVTRTAPTLERLTAFDVFKDSTGDFWLLATSPIVGLIKYDRRTGRFAEYPLDAGAIVLDSSKLLDDGGNGFGCRRRRAPYFDRRTERLTRHFQHDETDPNSLSDNSVVSLYPIAPGCFGWAPRMVV